MSDVQGAIKKGMDQIRASEELKQDTLRYLAGQRKRQDRERSHKRPYAVLRYAVAVLCLLILTGAGSYSVYSSPVAYISIDVNPSIELSINRFDRVVSVKGYNEDGQDILQHVALKNATYMQALDRLLQDAYYSRFLTRDSQLVVTVISERSDAIMEELNADERFQAYGAVTYSSDKACMDEAHQHEMSFGKYRAFLELSQYDGSITVEDCHGMTMGEIQDRIRTCQGHSGQGGREGHVQEHSQQHGHHGRRGH